MTRQKLQKAFVILAVGVCVVATNIGFIYSCEQPKRSNHVNTNTRYGSIRSIRLDVDRRT